MGIGNTLELMIANAIQKARTKKRKDKIRCQQKWGERIKRLNEALVRIETKEEELNR
jgi:hypothetical protein